MSSTLQMLVGLFSVVWMIGQANAESPELSFEKDIRPILKIHCFLCHGEEEKPKGKLDVRLPSLMVKGGASGTTLVPGMPEESLIWERIEKDEMPKGRKKVSPKEKQIIQKWIAQGAKTLRPEPKNPDDLRITEEERSFWAFQPTKQIEIPKVEGTHHPIDAFINKKLQEKGLQSNPIAEKRTLIRRVYFDLLGLPPTPEEVNTFVNDHSPNAYEKLIESLLSRPEYGERWGRHWLDVAGFAESDGVNSNDRSRPDAWKYRDYVIKSFNEDKPFDQFVREQLAGDEMVKYPYQNLSPPDIEKLTATGFLRMAPDLTEMENTPAERNQVIADSLKIVSSSLLGITVGCAQCHDHRYDPISQSDYYRFRAIFDPGYDWQNWRVASQRKVSLMSNEDRKKAQEIEAQAQKRDQEIEKKHQQLLDKVFEKEILTVPEDKRADVRVARNTPPDKRTKEQKELFKVYPNADVRYSLDLYDPEAFNKLQAERAEVTKLRGTKPKEEFIAVLNEIPGKIPETKVFKRGDHEQPKQTVTPGELPILSPDRLNHDIPNKSANLPTSGRRLAYAQMLTDGKHTLVTRVIVNRIWMHHFGRGIVGTPGDFGAFGERPTHPKLLDWLATEFVRDGWSIKKLHKLILTSETYQRSSKRNPSLDKLDPENRLLARSSVRRLEAEVIRDSILQLNGTLIKHLGGESIPVVENTEGMAVLGKQKIVAGLVQGVDAAGDNENRRSIYIQVRRRLPLGMLEAFDLPTLTPNCDARRFSTVAPQSLLMMNNEFILRQAEQLSIRISKEASGGLSKKIARLWEVVYSRPVKKEEIESATKFLIGQADLLKDQAPDPKKGAVVQTPEDRAFVGLCQVLLSSNEFLYVD